MRVQWPWRRGNDGLTNRQRRAYAKQWRQGQGSKHRAPISHTGSFTTAKRSPR